MTERENLTVGGNMLLSCSSVLLTQNIVFRTIANFKYYSDNFTKLTQSVCNAEYTFTINTHSTRKTSSQDVQQVNNPLSEVHRLASK